MLINFALTSIVSKSKICKIPPDLRGRNDSLFGKRGRFSEIEET
jgi:hypothetical protein